MSDSRIGGDVTDEEPVRGQSPVMDEDRRPDPARDRDRDPSRDPSRDPREVTDPTTSGRAGPSMAADLAAAVVTRAAAVVLRPYAEVQLASGEFAAARRAWELAVREDGAAVFHSANAITESERAEAAGTRWATKGTTSPNSPTHHEQQRAAARLRPAPAAQSAQRRR